MSSLLTRPRLIDVLRNAPPLAAVIAPAGWGKSALFVTAATSDLRVVPIALGSTEGHRSLLVEALAQGLRRAYPGMAVAAVRAAAELGLGEPPQIVLLRVRAALGVASLTLGFDEVERLPHGTVYELVRRLATERADWLRLIFASRQALPVDLGLERATVVLGARALALTKDEIERLEPDADGKPPVGPDVAGAIERETGGWPALVSARLLVSRALVVPEANLSRPFSRVADAALEHLSAEARYVIQIAAILNDFSRGTMLTLLAGEVRGSPDALRRLMRLEPAVAARALDELERAGLVERREGGEGVRYACLGGLQGVLRECFAGRDKAGWLEAHRRAAELRLAAVHTGRVEADVVDLLAASGERERLLDVLATHGARLELELAAAGLDGRLLGWVQALEGRPLPSWGDVMAGLVYARRGDWEHAKQRLERARDALAGERKTATSWRWQTRLAEAQGLAARAKGDATEARSWLLRGLDQLEQVKEIAGLEADDAAHANALALRLSLTLARLCRETTGWDMTRGAVTQALAALAKSGAARTDPRGLELARTLTAGAFAAGDVVALELASERADDIAQAAQIALDLLRDGHVDGCLERLRRFASDTHEPLAALFLVRLLPAGSERDRCLEEALASGDAWIVAEAALRSSHGASEDGHGGREGYFCAVLAEALGQVPGATLELARDAYRRVGARWDEARVWLALGAIAVRELDAGRGDAGAAVRAADGAVEAARAVGFAVPWTLAGPGETGPEGCLGTLLLAGLRGGQERTKDACRQELQRLGIDTRAVMAGSERGKIDAAPARRSSGVDGTPFLLISRGGTQALSVADYQHLMNNKDATSLVVCVPDELVLNFGRQLALGQKRVMLPLLLHFLRHPDESFSMLELAQAIWDCRELTATVQTKVKVAVSRLRALLGKNRNYIITTRKMEHDESVVAYQTAPQLQFQIVLATPQE